MSEENTEQQNTEPASAQEAEQKETQSEDQVEASSKDSEASLEGLYAFKVGMSSVYNEEGVSLPVTVLRYKPWVVTQLKTKEKDGYEAIQIACDPLKAKNGNAAKTGHLKSAGFENGARWVKEIRQQIPEGLKVGQRVSLQSLSKGDRVKMTGESKGRGFAGGMKRWNFGGGPASHGSGFHRKPGSIGNRTDPGRVIPGKRMAGHFGCETLSVKNVEIVDILSEDSVLLVKGPVPGARNSLVKLMRV